MLYFFSSRGTSYGRGGRINYGDGSVDWQLEVLVPFLELKVIGGQLAPSPTLFSPNTSNKIFEISTMFKVFQRYSLGWYGALQRVVV